MQPVAPARDQPDLRLPLPILARQRASDAGGRTSDDDDLVHAIMAKQETNPT